MAGVERSGRFAWSLVLADAVFTGLLVVLLNAYGLAHRLNTEAVAVVTAGIVLVQLVCLTPVHTWPPAARWPVIKILLANFLAAAVLPPVFARLSIPLDRRALCLVLAAGTPLQFFLHWVHRRSCATRPLEPLRWALIAAAGVTLGLPYLVTKSVGTGDAYWYGNMVSDFVTQWRAGIFPVFVGQSDFAFNGAVSPLRFAPYLQHAAGTIDLLTLHTLTGVSLLNVTLLFSLVAAGFTAYGSLVAIHPEPRWVALLLALLFISCPGVLALAYTGDLFMSVCALPYVPLVFYGMWRTLRQQDTLSVGFLATALAATWLCHPPIAFWAGIIAVVSQLIRLVREPRRPLLLSWLVGAGIFAALSAVSFVSVLTLRQPAMAAEPTFIIESANEAFPAAFLPVNEEASALSDYQLGWSLWAVLLAAVLLTLFQPRAIVAAWTLGVALLLLLLLPIPHVLDTLWHRMPQVIANITYHWPMQRFYVLLAALAIFMGYVAGAEFVLRRWWLHLAVVGALAFGLSWSGQEAAWFVQRGLRNTAADGVARLAELPQNRYLTRYSYNPFPHAPPYFSHGYVDPVWENRLLEPDSFRELTSNYRAVVGDAGTVRAAGPVTAWRAAPESTFLQLIAALPIEPGRHYALEFDFNHRELVGSLIISGPTLAREYYLPNSGIGLAPLHPSTAFGALPSSERALPLFSSSSGTENLLVQFVANGAVPQDVSDFGRYALREYDPARLPVVVENWAPYRAKVTAPARAWLETPRIFIDGYRAIVNGRELPVARSPDGLVMIPVEAGESRVKLSYPGPLSLRLAYGFSLAAWGGVLVLAGRALRRGKSPARA